jgi:hypothetical protein
VERAWTTYHFVKEVRYQISYEAKHTLLYIVIFNSLLLVGENMEDEFRSGVIILS